MWKLVISDKADKQFTKIDHNNKLVIDKFIVKLLATDDPYSSGKPLTGALRGIWRYRVGKYRLLCKIKNDVLIIYLIEIGKRDSIYD